MTSGTTRTTAFDCPSTDGGSPPTDGASVADRAPLDPAPLDPALRPPRPEREFEFDYRPLDDLADGQRFMTYWDVEPLSRGPRPLPPWVVTDRAAVDTELGVLKTGKEADVFLLERAVPGTGLGVVLAAKRYREAEHRQFHRAASYTQGRRVRSSRDARAMAKGTAHGRAVAAGQWAWAEWEFLGRCWEAGVPVPYPVQVDGTEILMELVTSPDGTPAPRLAQTRPDPDLLRSYFQQLREAMALLAGMGAAHGDLSPYNILAAGERLVVIDVPQVVDIVANPTGQDFLLRDCRNVCTWFRARGLQVDEQELFTELVVQAYGGK
ncbi:MAG: serine/threonine protein kinase [Actinomycetota bacterium]|nr:serine/threonine protein kinase [Actinomycetota bacterium]